MKNILCYGDSNTFGYNPENGERFGITERWTCLLQNILGDNYRIIEEGLGGRTTVFNDDIMPFRSGRDYLLPCIQSHQPLDLVVVMLGTNDLKVLFSPTAFDISRGMEELVKILKNPYNWDFMNIPKILIVSPIHVAPSVLIGWLGEHFGSASIELSRNLANHYEKIASSYAIEFLDAAKYASASDLDGIHLDAVGHRNLADALSRKIKDIIE
ncbi:MAG: hypothetical protein K0S71_829 [Clostridia bacterium]|jgi:lysophospholipase L1-like esterase|nr:hypothetical protein [Clostridia bacterium]